MRCRLDIPYGGGKLETLDLFPAASAGPPVLVFLHGGYWQAMDKSDFSFIASLFHAVGVAVAVVNYNLAPAAGMADIVAQVRRAVAFLAANGESLGIGRSRFFLAGHSAGGHLTAMAMLTDWSRFGLDRDPLRDQRHLRSRADPPQLSQQGPRPRRRRGAAQQPDRAAGDRGAAGPSTGPRRRRPRDRGVPAPAGGIRR